MNDPVMFYFGPWDRAGHYLFDERGASVRQRPADFPWDEDSATNGIDCQLQPGCSRRDGDNRHGEEIQGRALLHHKNGWTAISFWDRSVDTRGGCNSTYFAKGTFTFDQMVEMAKRRFAERWSRMKFEVMEESATSIGNG
jgi:hypothetical protein